MSTTPRIGSAIAGKAAGSATIYAHEPELRELFNRMYATLWSNGVADAATKEAMRLRNAEITGCGL